MAIETILPWQTGDLTVDRGLQRVERGGEAIELPRLSFDLLLALIEAAPNFVSNEELMTRVWRGQVVSPETVTQRVKLLRDALGDDPRSPRYIEGLRGRGYRWTPPASRDSRPGSGPDRRPEAPRPVTGAEQRWAVPLVALLVALAGIALWAMRREPASETSPPMPAASARTAAILPFESTGDERLGPGLADSVAAQLTGVRNLTVISRYSTLALGTGKLDPRKVGAMLGAQFLVRGDLNQQGTRLRATVMLLDSTSGQQLWTQQYTREASDFFALQDDVAGGVKHALESRISGLDPGLPPVQRSGSREAWLAYLRGRTLLGRLTVVGSDAAAREFEQSLLLDPDFLPAITGLYDARLQATQLRRGDIAAQKQANAELLVQARKLDPDAGALRLVQAIWSEDQPEQRAVEFEAGLAQDPGNARAMTAYSELLDRLERREEAALWLDRALAVDPLWPRAHFRRAQRNFIVVGSAVEQQNLRMLEIDPNYYPALQRHAKYQWQSHGKIAYPVSVIEKAIASDPENPWGPHTAVAFYLDAGDPLAAEDVVQGLAVAQASTRALRSLHAGDWKAAGEAAFARDSTAFGRPERWGVAPAIRDYALRTGDFKRALDYLSAQYRLPREGRWDLGTENFREAQLYAHLLLRMGRRDEAIVRLDEVIAWIDANGVYGPIYNLRTRAQALALQGRTDEALAELARSFEANDYTHWWYTLRFDPTWDSLRTDPRFVAIFDRVRAHVAAEQAELESMRKAGRVPGRHSGTGS